MDGNSYFLRGINSESGFIEIAYLKQLLTYLKNQQPGVQAYCRTTINHRKVKNVTQFLRNSGLLSSA